MTNNKRCSPTWILLNFYTFTLSWVYSLAHLLFAGSGTTSSMKYWQSSQDLRKKEKTFYSNKIIRCNCVIEFMLHTNLCFTVELWHKHRRITTITVPIINAGRRNAWASSATVATKKGCKITEYTFISSVTACLQRLTLCRFFQQDSKYTTEWLKSIRIRYFKGPQSSSPPKWRSGSTSRKLSINKCQISMNWSNFKKKSHTENKLLLLKIVTTRY